jgi:hypothetical protein
MEEKKLPLASVCEILFLFLAETHFQTNIDETKINIKTRTEHKRIMADACIDELL